MSKKQISTKLKHYEVTYISYGKECKDILFGNNIKEIEQYCAMWINGDVKSIKEV